MKLARNGDFSRWFFPSTIVLYWLCLLVRLMLVVIFLVFLLAIFIGPSLWVKYVLKKHSRELEKMPGTGGELAEHLLSQYALGHVKVNRLEDDSDHYNPQENTVNLGPRAYSGKSLTAVATAAHEVGHAIQFNRNEPVSFLRKRYLSKAIALRQVGVYILMAMPLVAIVVRIPQLAVLQVGVGLFVMIISVLMYVAILPEEFDASFNKALPMLKKGDYVPDVYMPAISQILRACALTYVAAALADVLKLWRWVRYLR